MSEHPKKTFEKITSIESLICEAAQKVADHEKERKENLIKNLVELFDKMQEYGISLNDIQIIVSDYIAGQITTEKEDETK